MSDKDALLSFKNTIEEKDISLEKIIINLTGLMDSDDIGQQPIDLALLEKAKEAHTESGQCLSLMDINRREKMLLRLWRNGFIGTINKHPCSVERAKMRFFLNAYKYLLEMDKAVITNNDDDFFIAAKAAIKLINSMKNVASAVLAELSLYEKEDRKRKGKKNMLEVSSGNKKRDEKITANYQELTLAGKKREAAGILASKYNLSTGQIRRIVK